MKKYIFINVLFAIIYANELVLSPIIYANYESNGGTWDFTEKSIGVGGWGLTMEGYVDNFKISMDAYNNRFFGLVDKPNYFSQEQGLSWVGNDPEGEQFDFDVTNIKLSYDYKSIIFEMGKYNRHWGPGNSSLILSSNVPSFAQFGFNWNINSTLNFEYFHGSLRSLIEDDINSAVYEGIGAEVPEYNRYVVGHRINWDLSENLTIGASETIVYGVRNIDLLYLLPFAPFLSLQQYKGDLDNIQWGLDIDWHITDNYNLYFSFLMDEWDPSMTFDKPNRNWFGYQIGTKIKDRLIDNDSFILEYNWTDHRLYRHQNAINDYYSHGYPLGFWAGPHAQELYLNYTFYKFNSKFSIIYSNAKRGELTDQMLQDQYDNIVYSRFSNISESLNTFKILISRELKNGFEIHFGFSNIYWNNANFNPFISEQEGLVNSNKNSFSFGFSYNFDIFTQSSKIDNNSVRKIISL